VTDDLTLLEQWRAGDTSAGQALFQRHFDDVYGFFETKCGAEADELTQATFLACVKSRDQFRAQSSFRTYLFTIARHELHHLIRRRQRVDAKLDFEIDSIEDLMSSPATKLLADQERRKLVDALRLLPVDQQTLLELHYWQDMDIAALAEVFESPQPTIRTWLHRARLALRKQIESFATAQILESLDTMDSWVQGLRRPRSS
jgi:RNA polymerase sigma factor (sigma-70 family)